MRGSFNINTGSPAGGGGASLTNPNTFQAAQTIASGTITASAPALNITQTWNNAGVTFHAEDTNITNTASDAASTLLRRRVGGTEVASISRLGLLKLSRSTTDQRFLELTNSYGTATFDVAGGGDLVINSFCRMGTGGGAGGQIQFFGGPGYSQITFEAEISLQRVGTNKLALTNSARNSATPITATLAGHDGAGTNIVGGTLKIAPGISTGNATPGKITFQGTTQGSTGTTAQTVNDVFSIENAQLLRFEDGVAFAFGTSGGTQFGTANSQYLSFWGVSATTQPSGNSANGIVSSGMNSPILDDTTFDGGMGGGQYTVGGIVAALKTIGLLG